MPSRIDLIGDLEKLARKEGFRVKNFAEKCNLCSRQLERRLPDKVAAKPRVWMDRLKLRSAKDLLAKGELIKEVAVAVGFRHVRHFSRWFKRLSGKTPSQFRSSSRAR